MIRPSSSSSSASVSSHPIPRQSFDANAESPAALSSSSFGGANFTQEQMIRTCKLSFPGSWDDDELVDFVEHRINVDSSIPPKFKEPRYTPVHALYMHLHDDIDSDVDLERELWDAAEREAFMGGGATGMGMGVGFGDVGGQIGSGGGGELEEEQMGMGLSEAASTTKSVFGACGGSACHRHHLDLGSDRKCQEQDRA